MAAVKNALTVIAVAMEKQRGSMIVFKYRLGYIQQGKTKFADALKIYKDDIREYTRRVEKITAASKERKALLAEKKGYPCIQCPQTQGVGETHSRADRDAGGTAL